MYYFDKLLGRGRGRKELEGRRGREGEREGKGKRGKKEGREVGREGNMASPSAWLSVQL